MIVINISRLLPDKKLLKADIYKATTEEMLTQSQDEQNKKPIQEITARPTELVTKVLKELQQLKEPVCSFPIPHTEVPAKVLSLLQMAITDYNATLPDNEPVVVKVWKGMSSNPNHIDAIWYPSDKTPRDTLAQGGFMGGQGGDPIIAALQTLKFLHNSPRVPVKREFGDDVPQKAKDLFTEVIGLYNKSLELKK